MECLRCHREFSSPVPKVTKSGPDYDREIACKEWCGDCNAFAMTMVRRENTAYYRSPPFDPLKGGIKDASS